MKQIIEIEVPDGKKAVLKNNRITFEDAEPRLPETWEKFCEQNAINKNEAYINGESDIYNVLGLVSFPRDNKDKNLLPSIQAAEAHLALMQLHQLRDCYRQGWKPDWNDCNQEKYVVELKETSPVEDAENAPFFLAFQSYEIAEKFKANFIDLIKQASDLIYM